MPNNDTFEGNAFVLDHLDGGIFRLTFDLKGASVNKINTLVMQELNQVLDILEASDASGLLIRSTKAAFIVGADVTEFNGVFAGGEEAIKQHLSSCTTSFNRLEDLPFPTVVAINSYALGGGAEFCFACDSRIGEPNTKIGLPETKLGIIPGWGGTVRLPRLAGVDVAVEWIASGKEQRADKARADGVLDGVVPLDKLEASAERVLRDMVSGKLPYLPRREQKKSPLKLNDMESILSFESSKAFVKGQAGRHYPAPVAAIQVMQNAAKFGREDALNFERDEFAKLAQGSVTQSLVGLFLSDQLLGKKAKAWAKKSTTDIDSAAVLGAGIMGGGIAYQSAYKNIPILMKDIAQEGLNLGVSEAGKLLNKRVERGRLSVPEMTNILNRITPTLSYEGFGSVDIVVEAVVENEKVKCAVLQESEKHVSAQTILCSNTSTISINALASALQRPENFCGMHFFNPVHAMPLVEVIRGEHSSEQAIAATVAYANKLGKKAVVVNDCPGFLVNRVLFPYFAGFSLLLRDGADFQQVDKVMERWGWPMGPAYLMDVVGIDTGIHAESVMAKGFPDRMQRDYISAADVLFEHKRYGQKNGLGFYAYEKDKKGKPQKIADPKTYDLLKECVTDTREFTDEEIIARMMVPMATELLRCLDEGIVDSAAEADMALIYGLGFPPFRGGICRWLDSIGWPAFQEMASTYTHLGSLYELNDAMVQRINNNNAFYPLSA